MRWRLERCRVTAFPSRSIRKPLLSALAWGYANIVNDRSAVFYTTYTSAADPFTDLDDLRLNLECHR